LIPRRLRIGLAALALCLPILAGCGSIDGGDDDDDTSSLLPMTLTEWLFAPDAAVATADPVGVAHLSITPMKPGDNDLTIGLTDLEGAPFDLESDATLDLTWRLLAPDATGEQATLEPDDDTQATWRANDLELGDQGWYAFDLAVTRGDTPVATSTMYALLPDPSVHGADALDLPDSDAGAEALYQRALDRYGAWKTGRWRENLGSGADVLVVTQYAVDSRDPEAAAMSSRSTYAGSFRPQKDGSPPSPVQHDFAQRIAIGERWWSLDPDGQWSESSGPAVSTFTDRADIYTGATNIQPGGSETINGIDTEIITFYLPAKTGQSEAWFAWWIDPETGDPVRIAMVAQMHFMIWDFYDVDAPMTITRPDEAGATPAASPVATPSGS
jgi:hypothetical protein